MALKRRHEWNASSSREGLSRICRLRARSLLNDLVIGARARAREVKERPVVAFTQRRRDLVEVTIET
jgi:hypothetical protein